MLAGLAIAWASGGLGALGRLLGERRAGAAQAELIDELFGPVLERPELRARAQGLSGAEQQALLFELARDGVARLPDEALLERLELLREVAANGDEATCAMVLVGGPPAAAAELLAALDDGTLRRWLTLSRDAVLANLRGDPARPLAPEDAERARAALVGALSPADAERFDTALRAPASLSRREACALARATLEAAAALPPADRQLVARLFASG